MSYVLIRFRAGPTWRSGGVREQPGWNEHADFVDALVDDGTMIMGGPFADNSGSVVVFHGVTEEEARRILERDPFIENGVFEFEDVRAWDVFVNRR